MRILRRFLARVANFVTRREDDRRLRSLEDENSRLKRLVAGLSLDREMLKAVIAKKRPQLVDRRTEAQWLAWVRNRRSSFATYSLANRRRTLIWRASTVGCIKSAYRLIGSPTYFEARGKVTAWENEFNQVTRNRSTRSNSWAFIALGRDGRLFIRVGALFLDE